MDPHTHKQLLLTRIALDRAQLRLAVDDVRRSASLGRLLGGAFQSPVLRRVWAVGAPADGGGWLGTALALLRRYRLAATALGLITSVVGPRRRLPRFGLLAAVAGGAWVAWRASRAAQGPARRVVGAAVGRAASR